MDYSKLSISELRGLSFRIKNIIMEKEKYEFSSEYMRNLENILDELLAWMKVNVVDIHDKSIEIICSNEYIIIDFQARHRIRIKFEVRIQKWYLKQMLSYGRRDNELIDSGRGLVLTENGIFVSNQPDKYYETPEELVDYIKVLIRMYN